MKTAGRPTKYDEKMLSKAKAYVQRCQSDKEMPFIEELALTLDVNDDSIVEWAKEHDEFSATVKRLKLLQKLRLKDGALQKKLHPTMAIFLLKANHGLSEKEPDMPQEDRKISVTFYGSEKIMEEVNECLAKNKAGRVDGPFGEMQYLSEAEAKPRPPTVISKHEPKDAAEAIANADAKVRDNVRHF